MIRFKHVYSEPNRRDGKRVLVDRVVRLSHQKTLTLVYTAADEKQTKL